MSQIRVAICFSLLALLLLPTIARSQTSAFASIAGDVIDNSGSQMPKVVVRVKSPVLQVPEVVAITDDAGRYQILNLPAPGVYTLSFESAGFQTYVREGLNLSVGFAAKIDVSMKLGQVSQTVEVQCSSPGIDTTNTSGNTTLQQLELQETPKGGSLQELFPMAAG